MRPLSNALVDALHPDVYRAMVELRERGTLDWTPPAGTPVSTGEHGPRCQACNDVGLVAHPDPASVVTPAVPCSACNLIEERRRQHLPRLYQSASFDSFQAKTAEARDVLADVRQLVAQGGASMIIQGPIGSGKTTLISAAFLELLRRGDHRSARFVTVPDLLEEIRNGYDHELRIPRASEVVDWVTSCDLLVLDDLGAEALTDRNAPWVLEQLYRVIGRRHNELRATLITSNYTDAQLTKRLDERIVSRVLGMCRPNTFWLDQPDFRVTP